MCFFAILFFFFAPQKTKQGNKYQRFGKQILEHEWPKQAVQRSQCCVLCVSDGIDGSRRQSCRLPRLVPTGPKPFFQAPS